MEIVRLILVFLLGILWASSSYVTAFTHDELGDITESEYEESKNKKLYLIRLAFEGPFIFLRLLKK